MGILLNEICFDVLEMIFKNLNFEIKENEDVNRILYKYYFKKSLDIIEFGLIYKSTRFREYNKGLAFGEYEKNTPNWIVNNNASYYQGCCDCGSCHSNNILLEALYPKLRLKIKKTNDCCKIIELMNKEEKIYSDLYFHPCKNEVNFFNKKRTFYKSNWEKQSKYFGK